jgi:hypothetical protein
MLPKPMIQECDECHTINSLCIKCNNSHCKSRFICDNCLLFQKCKNHDERYDKLYYQNFDPECKICGERYNICIFDNGDLTDFIHKFELTILEKYNILNCLVYYNTNNEKDTIRLTQSRRIIKFIKNRQVFESVIEKHLKEAIFQNIITEEMLTRFKYFSIYHSVEVIRMLDVDFIDEEFDEKLDMCIHENNNPHLYTEDYGVLIKFLYYCLMLFPFEEFNTRIININYDIAAPKDAIGCFINKCLPKTFFFNEELRVITNDNIKKFVEDIWLDSYPMSDEALITERFIERFLNLFDFRHVQI